MHRVGWGWAQDMVEGETLQNPQTKHTKQTRKHNTAHGKICQREQQHVMASIVGRGWQWTPMVGIYGCECVWWGVNVDWGTEKRQVRAKMIIIGSSGVQQQTASNRKQCQVGRGKDGHSFGPGAQWVSFGAFKPQAKTTKQGSSKKANRTATRAHPNGTGIHAKMHVCNA